MRYPAIVGQSRRRDRGRQHRVNDGNRDDTDGTQKFSVALTHQEQTLFVAHTGYP